MLCETTLLSLSGRKCSVKFDAILDALANIRRQRHERGAKQQRIKQVPLLRQDQLAYQPAFRRASSPVPEGWRAGLNSGHPLLRHRGSFALASACRRSHRVRPARSATSAAAFRFHEPGCATRRRRDCLRRYPRPDRLLGGLKERAAVKYGSASATMPSSSTVPQAPGVCAWTRGLLPKMVAIAMRIATTMRDMVALGSREGTLSEPQKPGQSNALLSRFPGSVCPGARSVRPASGLGLS
jgi:hypothetical protein